MRYLQLQQNKRFNRAVAFFLCVFIIFLFVLPGTVLADDEDQEEQNTYTVEEFKSDLTSEINSILSMVRTIGASLAALAAVWTFFKMMVTDDENETSRYKKQLTYIIIAIGALCLLPAVVNWAMKLFGNNSWAWDPDPSSWVAHGAGRN